MQEKDGCGTFFIIFILIYLGVYIMIEYYKIFFLILLISVILIALLYFLYQRLYFSKKFVKYDSNKNMYSFENKYIKINYYIKDDIVNVCYNLKFENLPETVEFEVIEKFDMYFVGNRSFVIKDFVRASKKIFKIAKDQYLKKYKKEYEFTSLTPYKVSNCSVKMNFENHKTSISGEIKKSEHKEKELKKIINEMKSDGLLFEKHSDYAIIRHDKLLNCHINLLSPYNINILYEGLDGVVINKIIKNKEIVEKVKQTNEKDINQIVKIADLIIELIS